MATAEIAIDALGIKFDIHGIHDYLCRYDEENGNARNTSASSYKVIVEQCDINEKKFYRKSKKITHDNDPKTEIWGRFKEVNYILEDGRKVVQEIEVRPSIVEKILAEKGFSNIETCTEAWTNGGLISRDKDRPTRSRKVDPFLDKYEDVYVFRVFEKAGDSSAGN